MILRNQPENNRDSNVWDSVFFNLMGLQNRPKAWTIDERIDATNEAFDCSESIFLEIFGSRFNFFGSYFEMEQEKWLQIFSSQQEKYWLK